MLRHAFAAASLKLQREQFPTHINFEQSKRLPKIFLFKYWDLGGAL